MSAPVTAAEFGRLLTTWGLTQGGSPSLSVSLVDGAWRWHLHAGRTTIAVLGQTYADGLALLTARIRHSMVTTLALAEVAP